MSLVGGVFQGIASLAQTPLPVELVGTLAPETERK